ncbi:MAG: hypothetical protein V3V75_08430 [Thermoguttaceae bacterium]
MHHILFEYEISPPTWVYLSSLLTIGIYFKFRRFWSVRNLDLFGLIAFSPGLLLVGRGVEQLDPRIVSLGYTWLFIVGGFFLIRLLLDPIMVRRPLLEPNLSAGGLTFAGVALLVFLSASVLTGRATESDLEGALWGEQSAAQGDVPPDEIDIREHGPGYPPFYRFSDLANNFSSATDNEDPQQVHRRKLGWTAARTTAILGHLAVVIGMVLIGYRHFDNVHTGAAAAALYLLLPYTSQIPGQVDHVIPAALLIWAVEAYRRPVIAGILLGLATGLIYYPLFLLPLWCGFYWRRGLIRFAIGFVLALLALVALLAFTSADFGSFLAQLQQMCGFIGLSTEGAAGFWQFHEPAFRIPVVAAFIALCGSLALWPAQKDLGTLLSCSAAVMLGTQFWNVHYGGVYMAWYLPLLVLTIFRPNLEDRLALSALTEGWNPWRRAAAGG